MVKNLKSTSQVEIDGAATQLVVKIWEWTNGDFAFFNKGADVAIGKNHMFGRLAPVKVKFGRPPLLF